jgi:hypothetical protein
VYRWSFDNFIYEVTYTRINKNTRDVTSCVFICVHVHVLCMRNRPAKWHMLTTLEIRMHACTCSQSAPPSTILRNHHIHIYTPTCAHACMHTCIYTHMHTHTHTCIHTQISEYIHMQQECEQPYFKLRFSESLRSGVFCICRNRSSSSKGIHVPAFLKISVSFSRG